MELARLARLLLKSMDINKIKLSNYNNKTKF